MPQSLREPIDPGLEFLGDLVVLVWPTWCQPYLFPCHCFTHTRLLMCAGGEGDTKFLPLQQAVPGSLKKIEMRINSLQDDLDELRERARRGFQAAA